jgi:hypothetical protein
VVNEETEALLLALNAQRDHAAGAAGRRSVRRL